jgi:Spy/CpxP family protein refolding chaperone
MRWAIWTMVLVSVSFQSLVFGQGLQHRRGWGPPPSSSMEDWMRQLNLTEEQVAQIRTLHESFRQETLPMRDALMMKRFRLRDLFLNPQADANQILAAQREVSEMEGKLQERATVLQLEIRKILTPEQIKLLPPGFGFEPFPRPGMMPGRMRGMGPP